MTMLVGAMMKMTERFTYDSKTVSILKDGEFWLDGNIDTACNHSEICNELNKLADENEKLKAQLYCDYDSGVCRICESSYLVESGKYFVSKCRKGNDECSKESLRYCEDFEVLKGDV